MVPGEAGEGVERLCEIRHDDLAKENGRS